MNSRNAPTDDSARPTLLVDAHAHLWQTAPPASSSIPPGVLAIVNSTGTDDLVPSAEFVKRNVGRAILFVGLHPTNPIRGSLIFEEWVQANRASIAGIGEIGLDSKVGLEASRREFVAQLELASSLGKPVCVHSRGRVMEVLEELSAFDLSVLLHWFQGTEGEQSRAAARGYFFTFGPPLLYSKPMQRLFRSAGKEALLLETDSPVPYSACFEARRSEPSMIASVYLQASYLLGVELPELELTVERNAASFVGEGLNAVRR